MATKRRRRAKSLSGELVAKSRESALSAIQIYNSPQITFKAEIFIVLMNIAWTYLLHAYFRKQGVEYRYFEQRGKVRRFDRTKQGAYKFWELERCLNDKKNPIDKDTSNNLRFLIGVRHEIEHQMTSRIDASFSAKFQACCLNYNSYLKKLFGEGLGIERELTFSLQLSSISKDQNDQLGRHPELPAHIQGYVEAFEGSLTEEEYNSPKFAYRVLFVQKTANRKGQADEVIEFVKADTDLAKDVNRSYAVIKETERKKFLPGKIVGLMRANGFPKFNHHHHANFWKDQEAKAPEKGLGVQVEKTWYWYEPWLEKVKQFCAENAARFS